MKVSSKIIDPYPRLLLREIDAAAGLLNRSVIALNEPSEQRDAFIALIDNLRADLIATNEILRRLMPHTDNKHLGRPEHPIVDRKVHRDEVLGQ